MKMKKVGFLWTETGQNAFEKALEIAGDSPSIAVLRGAAKMLALVDGKGN